MEAMNRNKAVILLFFTLLPVLFYPFFIGTLVNIINRQSDSIPTVFFVIVFIYCGMMMGSMALLIIYIKDVFKNENIEESKRALWLIVLCCGFSIAMLIYWYINIWKPIKMNQKITSNAKVI